MKRAAAAAVACLGAKERFEMRRFDAMFEAL